MWWLLPVGTFIFVLATFATLNRIHRNEPWTGPGIVAALAAMAICFGWMDTAARM